MVLLLLSDGHDTINMAACAGTSGLRQNEEWRANEGQRWKYCWKKIGKLRERERGGPKEEIEGARDRPNGWGNIWWFMRATTTNSQPKRKHQMKSINANENCTRNSHVFLWAIYASHFNTQFFRAINKRMSNECALFSAAVAGAKLRMPINSQAENYGFKKDF